jgi:hypothetical protein
MNWLRRKCFNAYLLFEADGWITIDCENQTIHLRYRAGTFAPPFGQRITARSLNIMIGLAGDKDSIHALASEFGISIVKLGLWLQKKASDPNQQTVHGLIASSQLCVRIICFYC